MFRIKQFINLSKHVLKYPYTLRNFSKSNIENQIAKPSFRVQSKEKNIGPIGWFLLLVPATTFGLGTWQIQRKRWKENLIANLQSRSNSQPVPLPEDLSELKDLEYYPVIVKGHFLHDKELYMGPRSLLTHGDASTQGGLMSKNQSKNTGYLVITPFKLADRDLTILINRGWVSQKNKDPRSRKEGQITEEVELIGVVRLHENRPNFIPNNNPDANSWFYRFSDKTHTWKTIVIIKEHRVEDLNPSTQKNKYNVYNRDLDKMAKLTGAAPIFLDAVSDFDVTGGPIGGQTRITLRNEHLSYIFTWYSLCGFTSFMWYRQFLLKLPPI